MSDIEVFDDRICLLGEGPFYEAATGRAGWVDVLGKRVLWRHPETGEADEITCPTHVGAAIPRTDGGLVLCMPDGPVLRSADSTLHPLGGYAQADRDAGVAPGETPIRSNDAKPDPVGRLWLGTMAYDTRPGAGALYRLDPAASAVMRMLGDITISNGLAWPGDGTIMYYVDTPTGRIDAFDYRPATGTLDRRRPFVDIPPTCGAPDGICTDTDGGVWVALWGGSAVHRYSPDGTLDRVIQLPTPQVSSCAFIGSNRELLIITTASVNASDPSAGRTYQHHPGNITGMPVQCYSG